MKYRIKTKSEFLKDFGPKWREVAKAYFAYNMDELFGLKLGTTEWFNAEYGKYTIFRGWNISQDMVKPINNLNPNIKIL